jgi:similar to spore coat protein
MNAIVENLTGMSHLTDHVIASDLLLGAKQGVKDYAVALTEAATPEVRAMLKKHLDEAILMHEQVFNYMHSKGWYNAYDPKQQIALDIQGADVALSIAD